MCTGCGLAYPVRDDIPVLLVDEARTARLTGPVTDDGPLVRRVQARRRVHADRCRPRRCASWPSPGHAYAARPSRPRPRCPRPSALAREQARPRAVVAAGPDSRLLRAALEPWCPVPFVAWPNPGLPGWAGGLDLVVVLAPDGGDVGTASAVAEAVRRGCQVVVAAPPRVARRRARRRPLEHDPAHHRPRPAGHRRAGAGVPRPRRPRPAGRPRAGRRGPRPRRDVVLAAPRHRGQPRQDAGDRARRRQPRGLGRLGARRPGRPAGRRVDPPGQRPHGHRRRRRAPAAGHRGGGSRATSSTTRSPTSPASCAPCSSCSTTGPTTRSSASSAAGSRRRPPSTAYASRRSTRTPPRRSRATPRCC